MMLLLQMVNLKRSIFIHSRASSGVGLIGLQIGKCLGASLIFGSSSNQSRLKKLSEFGAIILLILTKVIGKILY